MRRIIYLLLLTLTSLALVACGTAEEQAAAPATASSTPRPPLIQSLGSLVSATASPSPSPSPTLTSTPTPTATAAALELVGLAPRAYTLFDPLTIPGAACGWVDTLDFPLQPPDGLGAYGGRDFNVFRSRYDKYHAGEDWGLESRRNLGQPVYSIGHGQVTYAAPEGWGLDKGVIIILHTSPDGDWFYSFYGHLDPESVVLRPGDCVWRGDPVGEIGQPRTPPHLHFEIRTILPDSPGPGYWATDPVRAGWLPPSQTISEYRLRTSPGVAWTRPPANERSQPLGNVDALFLVIEDEQLLGLALATGRAAWSIALPEDFRAAALAPEARIFYQQRRGLLEAYALPPAGASDIYSLELLWSQEIDSFGLPRLLALPTGGLFLGDSRTWQVFSAQGELLWQQEGTRPPASWASTPDGLLLSVASGEQRLWSVDEAGLQAWDLDVSGQPVVAGEQAWLYAGPAVYRLDLQSRQAELVYQLPSGFSSRSQAAALPDGGLLLAHSDPFDSRLLAFAPDGSLRWEYSYAGLGAGAAELLVQDGSIYLLLEPATTNVSGQYALVRLFRLEPDLQTVSLVFEGGSRNLSSGSLWAAAAGLGQVWLHIPGGAALLLNPQAALARMAQ